MVHNIFEADITHAAYLIDALKVCNSLIEANEAALIWQPEQLTTTYCSSLKGLNRSTVGITQGDHLAISFCATCIQQMTSLGVSKSCWFTDKCD